MSDNNTSSNNNNNNNNQLIIKNEQQLSYLAKLPSVTSPIQIDGTDVIKIVEQYLAEAGLHRTLRALQDETGVRTNCVADPQIFYNDILQGHWQAVLQQLHNFALSTHQLVAIYEHIIFELCEVEEFETATLLFETLPCLQNDLLKNNKERYNTLQRFIQNRTSDPKDLYGVVPRAVRRQKISDGLRKITPEVPKNRLYHIISNSLRYQQMVGLLPQHISDYNFFEDKLATHSIEEQRPAIQLYHDIDCNFGLQPSDLEGGELIHINTALFTTNGRYLITGNSVGLIEVWDYDRGKLATDLEYQVNEQFMSHLHPITSLAVSNDSALLASASSNGDIRVWSILSGQCVVAIRQAHASAISNLSFSSDGLLLLSTSGSEVKSWNLQNTAVSITLAVDNQVVYSAFSSLNLQQLVSTTVLVLDSAGYYYLYTNGDLVMKKQLMTSRSPKCTGLFFDKTANTTTNGNNNMDQQNNQQQAYTIAPYNAQSIRIRPDVLLLTSRGDNAVYTISDQSGDVLSVYTTAYNPNRTTLDANGNKIPTKKLSEERMGLMNVDLLHVCTSALAKYIYAASPQNVIYVFHFENEKIEKIFQPHGNNVLLSICHHPFRNLFVTTSLDGRMKIWR